jgi:cell wall-associated NlpC family hydrolase
MVVGRDLRQPIPGYGPGAYTGATHGPNTLSYLLWGGVVTISRSELQAGDLLVWQSHMGISLGGDQMISSLDTKDGVKVTSIEGGSPAGEVLFCKRLTGLSGVTPAVAGSTPPSLFG